MYILNKNLKTENDRLLKLDRNIHIEGSLYLDIYTTDININIRTSSGFGGESNDS